MTFDEWIKIGIDNKWCGPAVCSTHDGIPMSSAEETQYEEGDDPCIHVVRLYEDGAVADAVAENFFPYNYRQ